MTVRTPGRAVAAAVFSLAVLAVGGAAVAGASPDEVGPPACRVAGGADGRPWLADDAWDAATGRVGRVLDERFGAVSKRGDDQRLARGLIGAAADWTARELVVVADPAKVGLHALGAALAKAGAPDLAVRVQEGCHSSADLVAAQRVVRSRAWHPDAGRIAFTMHVDARTSVLVVGLPPAHVDGPVGTSLEQRLRDLVDVKSSAARS
jgi:hypothetical protein